MDLTRQIRLTVANQVLATFGITEPSAFYDRRVRNDALAVGDLHEILAAESPFVIGVDWRAALPDVLEHIAAAIQQLGTELSIEVDADADEGWVACGPHRKQVRFIPATGDGFTSVIHALQKIVPPAIEFRASTSNGTQDGWEFAVLLADEWSALEALDSELMRSLFLST